MRTAQEIITAVRIMFLPFATIDPLLFMLRHPVLSWCVSVHVGRNQIGTGTIMAPISIDALQQIA
jgi:hypothetical protein